MHESTLEIAGFEDRKIKCSFFEPPKANTHVAVMLPGAGYNCDQPLLYYVTELFLVRNSRVLQVHTNYSQQERFTKLREQGDRQAADAWILDEARKISAFVAKNFKVPISLIGKSVGTFAMSEIVDHLPHVQAIWLTPSMSGRWTALTKKSGHDLVVIGTKDPFYSEARSHLPKDALLVENADHALEISGSPILSVDALKQVLGFIDQHLIVP